MAKYFEHDPELDEQYSAAERLFKALRPLAEVAEGLETAWRDDGPVLRHGGITITAAQVREALAAREAAAEWWGDE